MSCPMPQLQTVVRNTTWQTPRAQRWCHCSHSCAAGAAHQHHHQHHHQLLHHCRCSSSSTTADDTTTITGARHPRLLALSPWAR